MSTKRDKCLLCKTSIKDRFWTYLWRKKRGFCCEECGHAIHDAGYKILDSLAGILKEHGVTIQANKEKFGYYRLSVMAPDTISGELASRLFDTAEKEFPEFSFDFSIWVKGQETEYR